MPSKKSLEVSFVTSGTQKVEDFQFLPKGVCRTAPATPGLLKRRERGFFRCSEIISDLINSKQPTTTLEQTTRIRLYQPA